MSSVHPEAALLGALTSRQSYQKYRSYLSQYIFSEESAFVFGKIDQWYKNNEDDIDWGKLRLTVRLESSKAKDVALYALVDKFIEQVEESLLLPADPSIMAHFIQMEYAAKASDALDEFTSGSKDNLDDLVAVSKDIAKYSTLGVEKSIESHRADFDDVAWSKAMSPTGGLNWKMDTLQKGLGPLRQGNFIVVAARPESGKTSFALEEALHMALQLPEDRPVLFFHNEEAQMSVELRSIQALFNCTTKELFSNPKNYKENFETTLKNRFILWCKNDMKVRDCEQAIDHYNPGLIVFNLLPKVDGFASVGGSSATDTTRLAKLFQWGRNLAIDQAPTIALMQAGELAEGKQWIHMNMLHGSKTDVCGEADGVITMGKQHSTTGANVRYFLIAKNKMLGGPASDPSLSHAHFEVYFDRHRCKFQSMLP